VLFAPFLQNKRLIPGSTEAEFVGIDDVVSKVLWMKLFIEAQNIYRDNTSSMKLEENGKASSGKCTRHFNIKYFYITDLIQCNDIQIEYCPTEEMVANYMTKSLVGAKFEGLHKIIMNEWWSRILEILVAKGSGKSSDFK
jgi:hypothetical protein